MLSFMFACEKFTYNISQNYTARIVGFDQNCSTCILEFPDDNMLVKEEIGESSGNYYEAINLSKGTYEIGQMLRVKIRKADINELTPCITLYPSHNYENVFITESENFNNLTFNDTIELSYKDCLYDLENHVYICLDSVLNDSRCPTGVYCFWEGNAEVRLKFEKLNEKPILFNLNTHRGFTADTIIDGYKFTLIGLNPYPSVEHRIAQEDYIAEIIVEKNK
jgi:hypothetical protein